MLVRAFLVFISAMLFAPGSIACVGADEVYDLDFRPGHESGFVIATLTSANGKTREILDDTGYIGIDLALTQIYGYNLKSGDLKVDQSSPALEFIRSRIPYMKSVLQKGLSDPKHKERLKLVGKSVDQFERIANAREVEYRELDFALRDLTLTLIEQKVQISGATRENANDKWGEEVAHGHLKLPSRPEAGSTARGGCNDQIGKISVQQSVGAAVTPGGSAPKVPEVRK